MTCINCDANFERIIGRGCTFLRPHKNVMHMREGLNDPQQAAGGGLLAARMSWLESTESAQWA